MKLTLSRPILVATIVFLACAQAFAQIAIPAGHIFLKGNHPRLANHLRSTGDLSPRKPLSMRLTLAIKNRATLDQLVIDQQDPTSPRYHQWLTSAEFDAEFGPSQEQADAVTAWLTSQGFQVTGASIPLRSIRFSGTSSQVQRAFQTSLKTFAGGSSYANVTDPVIPPQFAGLIARIDGLDNIHSSVPISLNLRPIAVQIPASDDSSTNGARDHAVSPDAKISFGDYFGPNDFYSFYDQTPLKAAHINGASSNGDCIGIVGVSDFLNSAIKSFNTRFNLPASQITRVPINAANPGFNSAEPEALIDLEWSHTSAPGAPIRYYMGAGADDLLDAINGAVTDNKCAVISISFGFASLTAPTIPRRSILFSSRRAVRDSRSSSPREMRAPPESSPRLTANARSAAART